MKSAFKCLYYLDNGTHSILEIKRTDLPSDSDIADVFKWLYLDKQTLEISPLTFRSMDSSDDVQERFFDQGYLKFNNDTGTFIEKFNSAQHQLTNKTGTVVTPKIQEAIAAYLDN